MMRSMISINSVIISSSSVTEKVKAAVSLHVVVSTAWPWPACTAEPHSWLQPSPAQQQNSIAGCVTSCVRVQGVEQPSPVSQHPWDTTSWPSRRVWQYPHSVTELPLRWAGAVGAATERKGLPLAFLIKYKFGSILIQMIFKCVGA